MKCVVAQEHMSPNIFARLFNLAAQCANSIGIHDWERGARGQVESEDSRERQCVSYCLYILDKEVCWTVGTSPCIPTSDVHIETTTDPYDDRAMGSLVAKAKLAEIQETIYLEIYARRAPSRTDDQVQLLISNFNQRLQDWLINSGFDLEDMDCVSSPSSALSLEMSIGFANTQLLYMWPYREHTDVIVQRTEVARRCMRLVLRLWRSAVELGHQAVFPRLALPNFNSCSLAFASFLSFYPKRESNLLIVASSRLTHPSTFSRLVRIFLAGRKGRTRTQNYSNHSPRCFRILPSYEERIPTIGSYAKYLPC